LSGIIEGYCRGNAVSLVQKEKKKKKYDSCLIRCSEPMTRTRKAKNKFILNLTPVKQTNPEQPLYVLTPSKAPCSRHGDSFWRRGGRQKTCISKDSVTRKMSETGGAGQDVLLC